MPNAKFPNAGEPQRSKARALTKALMTNYQCPNAYYLIPSFIKKKEEATKSLLP
jgi:hypothetical protein